MSPENQFEQPYQQTLKTKRCPQCSMYVDPDALVCPNDGTSLVERFDQDPVFTNYEFLGTIGSGGMGVIYKARQVILNKVVAIKTLHPHLSSASAFRRFQLEGKATSLLSHPYIVAVHDFGMTQSGQTFMIMDFVEGETLDSHLKRSGQLAQRRFLRIFIDVCDAMAHAHRRSVIHRDLKSSNIMLTTNEHGEEEIRIMDFGIAKLVSDTDTGANQVTQTGEVIGTATCISPEQARGGKADQRSDLYALGCVMYEALASAPPFVGSTPLETMLMHLEQRPLPIKQASMGNEVDPRIERIVLRLLEKNPDDRFQSMDDLKSALIAVQRPGVNTSDSLASSKPTKLVARNRTWTIVCGILVALLILGGAILPGLLKPKIIVIPEATVPSTPVDSSKTEKTPVSNNDRQEKSNISASLAILDAEQIVSRSIRTQLEKNQQEVTVRIPFHKATDEDLVEFRGEHPETTGVFLNESDVTDEGLENLHDMKLVSLDINNTRAKDFDWIKGQNRLVHLSIEGTPVSPKGFKNIGTLTDLEVLHLNKTKFSDDDVPSLLHLQKLVALHVAGTQLSLHGYDQLLNALTKCVDLSYDPAVTKDGMSFLSGKMVPVDARSAVVLNAEADRQMQKGDFVEANLTLEKLIMKSRGRDRQMLVSALARRAACLEKLGLPYAAISLYRLAANRVLDGSYDQADMFQRAASILESLPGKANREMALTLREGVEATLAKAMQTADPHDDASKRTNDAFLQMRQKNLARIAFLRRIN